MAIREITTGQDSFLDIVANLVGVLIILVVVVGANAASSWSVAEASATLTSDVEEIEQQTQQRRQTVDRLRLDNESLEMKADREAALAVLASEQRHQSLVQLETVRQEVERQRAELSQQQQTEFERLSEQATLTAELADLQRKTDSIALIAPKVQTIEHYGNPISKTVFSDVIHVQLLNDRLTYIPMDELTDQMRSQWRVKAEKLRGEGVSRTLETVGPIGNFRLQYELRRSGRTTELTGYQLFPTSNQLGEPLSIALQSGSTFLRRLQQQDGSKTTIQVWVYPESVPSYIKLSNWLHQHGYLVGCWMPDSGEPISRSSRGAHISAQ